MQRRSPVLLAATGLLYLDAQRRKLRRDLCTVHLCGRFGSLTLEAAHVQRSEASSRNLGGGGEKSTLTNVPVKAQRAGQAGIARSARDATYR